jgi:hypothetical protein
MISSLNILLFRSFINIHGVVFLLFEGSSLLYCDVLSDCCPFIFKGQADFLSLEDEDAVICKTTGNTNPVTQFHIPEDLNSQHHCCEHLKSDNLIFVCTRN